jgi:hypothetical protein
MLQRRPAANEIEYGPAMEHLEHLRHPASRVEGASEGKR